MARALAVAITLSVLAVAHGALYLPGVSPTAYAINTPVRLAALRNGGTTQLGK